MALQLHKSADGKLPGAIRLTDDQVLTFKTKVIDGWDKRSEV